MEKEQKIGNIFGFTGGNYAGNVYDKDHLSPTLKTMQGGSNQPMIVETNQIPKCLNPKGGRSGIDGLQPSVQDRVYSVDGISTSITKKHRNLFRNLLTTEHFQIQSLQTDRQTDRQALR